MKKMTFAVWFTALLAVFTFSSCLDDETGGTRQASEIVKVNGYMGTYSFKSAHGYELIPTNAGALTMDINREFAFIQYGYNSDDVTQNMKKINVQLYGIMPIDRKVINESVEGMKEFANAPIRNITAGGSYSYFPITFWDPNIMFLPVNYFIKEYSDNKETQKEVASHDFMIYFDVNDPDAYDGSMILRVRHHVMDPALNKERYRTNLSIYQVNLSSAMATYESVKGAKPERIVVEYEEATNGMYEEHNLVSSRAEINYKRDVLDAYKK